MRAVIRDISPYMGEGFFSKLEYRLETIPDIISKVRTKRSEKRSKLAEFLNEYSSAITPDQVEEIVAQLNPEARKRLQDCLEHPCWEGYDWDDERDDD